MSGAMGEADRARLARAGIAPLPVEEGLALFDAVLAGDVDPVVVAARWDMAGLRARAENAELPSVLRGLVRMPRRAAAGAEAQPSAGPAELTERLAALGEAGALTHLTELVRSHVAAVLAYGGADSIDVDRAFNELGFDSLTAVELRNRLTTGTGLRLPSTLVFDHPTVRSLAEYLFRTLAPRDALRRGRPADGGGPGRIRDARRQRRGGRRTRPARRHSAERSHQDRRDPGGHAGRRAHQVQRRRGGDRVRLRRGDLRLDRQPNDDISSEIATGRAGPWRMRTSFAPI
ncbi:beta-ketoacyl reductase [Nonomuraea ferruginea]